MRKFTKAAAMLCAAAMVIPSASVFAAEDGGASELTEVGTYPISEEPLEFTMFRTNMPNVEDFQTNDFTKYMEDLTNIKFTFEAVARDDRAEKLNMEFNTNTYPDVIMHQMQQSGALRKASLFHWMILLRQICQTTWRRWVSIWIR